MMMILRLSSVLLLFLSCCLDLILQTIHTILKNRIYRHAADTIIQSKNQTKFNKGTTVSFILVRSRVLVFFKRSSRLARKFQDGHVELNARKRRVTMTPHSTLPHLQSKNSPDLHQSQERSLAKVWMTWVVVWVLKLEVTGLVLIFTDCLESKRAFLSPTNSVKAPKT